MTAKGKKKEEDEAVNCFFTNSCKNVQLCCNFCKIKNCEDRCHGDHTKCKFVDGPVKEQKETIKKAGRK